MAVNTLRIATVCIIARRTRVVPQRDYDGVTAGDEPFYIARVGRASN